MPLADPEFGKRVYQKVITRVAPIVRGPSDEPIGDGKYLKIWDASDWHDTYLAVAGR